MAMRLRDYQARSLAALEAYFDEATTFGARRAFVIQTERPYRAVPQLPELPYVCLRVPTGGGKTVMAAHTVGISARRWVQRDRVVCLWLVPSNAIREQTLRRLRTLGDPYREALDSRFEGPVTVMDLAEALYVQRGTLDGETVVIVATLAALRITDTEGRKIYEPAGALEHHFTGLAPELLGTLERREDGTPVESLANVLRLRRPVVIMDEAHNARTQLSFETLARFSPSGVGEFTATPATRLAPEAGFIASNVLAHVSAAELKAEEMIKLPVKLWTHGAWTDAVTDALAKQRELEEIAAREQQATGERIRPIVLFQAQANRAGEETITPAALKQALIDDHHVPAEQIAIETGSTRELEGVDLSAPTCPIRFVITVQALREGWDCPTAYVLCSIAEQASARAVEQLLGRVLRLPGARRKHEPDLNLAYAYVVSPSFATAALGLRDALVEAGFERLETETLVEEGRSEYPSLFHATPETPVRRVMSQAPDPGAVAALPPVVSGTFRFDYDTMTMVVTSPLSEEAAEHLAGCFTSTEAKEAVRSLSRESRQGPTGQGAAPPPVQRALVVPQLAIRTDHGMELFEESQFLEAPWRLADLDAALSDAEFPLRTQGGQEGVVDIGAQGSIEISFHDAVSNQLTLLEGEPGWTTSSLAVWLDAHIPHPDLTQSDVRLFIHRAVEALVARSGASVDQLAREKYRLCKALEAKIERHRAAQHVRAFQQSLFSEAAAVQVVPEMALRMDDPSRYSPNWLYEGAYRFRKHLFPHVGELKETGEEQDCAIRIDEHPLVATWVRNISNRPQTSFWLQTSTDRFYPDFVGELADGRVFVVEYKGTDRWTDDDSREKRAVGELWAAASGGRCVFVMPRGPDWGAIDAAFRAGPQAGVAR
ncbi:MAG: DEAD/DEAH box helicase family protein [Polyangiaceae bacterium]|nr:DEAD/DEAH box helicase family protein [Polyangiaceae bacterium]